MKVKSFDPIFLPLSISALMLIVFSLSSSFSYNIPLDDFRSNLAKYYFCSRFLIGKIVLTEF